MSRRLLLTLLIGIGVLFTGTGVVLSSWWTIAGGVVALTGAAWMVTEPQ